MANKKFGGAKGLNALNAATDRISESIEKVSSTSVQTPVVSTAHIQNEKTASFSTAVPFTSKEKSTEKDTIGVNILLPKDIYKRLQAVRLEMDNVPLRTLCLELVIEGLKHKEKGN